MLKKLRLQFTKTVMTAVAVVLFLLLAVINIINALSLIRETDSLLLLLERFDGALPDTNAAHEAIAERDFRYTAESPFETRFFIVSYNAENGNYSCELTQIASISEETARELAQNVLEKGRKQGITGCYRYLLKNTESESKIIFVDIDGSLHAIRSLMLICLLIYLLALAGTSLLVWYFSKRFARPIVQSIENQKRFMTDAEHELKTPITIIAATAEVLKNEIGENEWLNTIMNQTERMRLQTQSLLTLSRMDESNYHLHRQPVRLDLLMMEEAEQFQAMAEQRKLCVQSSIESCVIMQGQPDLLKELAEILLTNALQYTPEGGRIEIFLTEEEKHVQLRICNDADYIDQSETGHLFERFYRGKASRSRQTGGSGLGLSVAKAIAEKHGGTIACAVTKDKRFEICVQWHCARKGEKVEVSGYHFIKK